jgi:hypothetical protein
MHHRFLLQGIKKCHSFCGGTGDGRLRDNVQPTLAFPPERIADSHFIDLVSHGDPNQAGRGLLRVHDDKAWIASQSVCQRLGMDVGALRDDKLMLMLGNPKAGT